MSRNKAKGTKWEVELRDYLNNVGGASTRWRLWEVYRPAQEGFRDTGDLHGLPFFTVQAKNWKETMDAIRTGLDGVLTQAKHYGRPLGVNLVKRRRKNVRLGYAVLTVKHFAALVYALVRMDDELRRRGSNMNALDMIAEGLKRAP